MIDPPLGLIGWLIVGLIAGSLATALTRTRSGCFSSLVLGLVGACVGGFLFSLLGVRGNEGLIASIVVAFIGAVIVLGIGRLIPR